MNLSCKPRTIFARLPIEFSSPSEVIMHGEGTPTSNFNLCMGQHYSTLVNIKFCKVVHSIVPVSLFT